jgi:four helix bundle protein
MQDHRKLRVWQRAQEICVEVYQFSAGFPFEERFGLTAQVRKASVSVGANIAEGSRRISNSDKGRIINIAESEAAEAMSELDIALRLKYGRTGEAERLIDAYDRWLGMTETLRQMVVGEQGGREPSTVNRLP